MPLNEAMYLAYYSSVIPLSSLFSLNNTDEHIGIIQLTGVWVGKGSAHA